MDASTRFRFGVGRFVMLLALLVAAAQLLWIQTWSAPNLSAEAASQRTVKLPDPATRGPITDRYGKSLAFTIAAKALTFQPVKVRKELADAKTKNPSAPDPDDRLQAIAKYIHQKLGNDALEKDLLTKLRSDDPFAYLVRNVDPQVAADISLQYPEVGTERQDMREYPGGSLAANIIGATGWTGTGRSAWSRRWMRVWPAPTVP